MQEQIFCLLVFLSVGFGHAFFFLFVLQEESNVKLEDQALGSRFGPSTEDLSSSKQVGNTSRADVTEALKFTFILLVGTS